MQIYAILRRVDDRTALILPEKVVKHLKTDQDGAVEITFEGDGAVHIKAVDPAFARQMIIAEEAMERYRNALHELAKH